MKLVIVIMMTILMQVSASSFAQHITLKGNNINIKQVFAQIREQTGYIVLYESHLVNSDSKVNVNLEKASLEDALKAILKDQHLDFEIKQQSIILNKKPSAFEEGIRKVDIKGKVVDQKGRSIPGVSILIKGTSKGTSSDSNGDFSIALAAGENEIVISAIGFEPQTITVNNQTNFNIILKEKDYKMDEVVVVAYGTQKKVNLTGAIDVITSKSLENRPVTSAAALLQGLAPGMVFSAPSGGYTPGSRPAIQIRGRASLGGATEPLVVIDGIPSSMTDFNALNPNDIESVSVLKDAAASAVYGARAPYGVLLITTKMGTKNGRTIITYSSNYANVKPVKTPRTVDSYTFALARNQAQVDGRAAPFFTDAALDIIQDNVNNPGKYTLAQLNPVAADSWGGAGSYNNNDILDAWLRSSFRQQHDLSITGGGEKTSYYVSAGYVYQPGVLNFGNYILV